MFVLLKVSSKSAESQTNVHIANEIDVKIKLEVGNGLILQNHNYFNIVLMFQ